MVLLAKRITQPALLLAVFFSLIAPAMVHSGPGSSHPKQVHNFRPPAKWKTYRQQGVPFEFSYPEDFLLDTHVNAKLGFIFALMKKPGTSWLVDIDLSSRADYSTDQHSLMPMEEFAIKIARSACDADGPDESISCPGITRKKVFRNRNNLEVVEFYLKQIDQRYDPPKTTESLVGPVEAVLLPMVGSGQVLTFKYTGDNDTGLVSEKLLREIADSVKLAR